MYEIQTTWSVFGQMPSEQQFYSVEFLLLNFKYYQEIY